MYVAFYAICGVLGHLLLYPLVRKCSDMERSRHLFSCILCGPIPVLIALVWWPFYLKTRKHL
jgi:Kef-type K+ transport system membrane component KefB